MYADRCLCRKHERTDVQRSAFLRRNPVLFTGNQLCDCLNEILFRYLRHAQTPIGIGKTAGIHLRAKQQDAVILCAVGLQSLKCLLRIMQDHGCRIHRDRSKWNDAGIVPALSSVPVHDEHVIGIIFAKAKRFPCFWLFL